MSDPPQTPPAPARGRIALCLCGGGITGAMYQVGALCALDDVFQGSAFDTTRFDLYIGTSAGSFVATALCAGISPRRMAREVLASERGRDLLPARRTDIFRFEPSQAFDVASKLTLILLRALPRLLGGRLRIAEFFEDLDDALPAGIFSLRHYESFLDRFMQRHGLPTRFADLPRDLYITANDLDSGHRVIFGGRGDDYLARVPIAKAICASSAIPIFFEPVRIGDRDYIDGGTGKVGHVDVALKNGATLVLVINPMVPIRNDPHREALPAPMRRAHHLRDKGLLTVYDQTMRMSIKSRLHQDLRRWRAERPDVSILLLEPDERDRDMFLYNPMNFAARRQLLRYGYESVAEQLRGPGRELAEAFLRHGIRTDPAGLSARLPS